MKQVPVSFLVKLITPLKTHFIGANFYFRFNWTELKKIDEVFKSEFKLNLANTYTNRYVSSNSVEVIALVCYKLAYPHRFELV